MDKNMMLTMENDFSKTAMLQSDAGGEYIFTECNGDFILPDYLPEIRKILRINTKVIPSGKFLSGSRAEFAGSCVHTIIYANSEGGVTSSTQSCDYEFSLETRENTSAGSVSVISMPERVSYRLSGPRKISVKTTVKSRPHILASIPCDMQLSSFSGDDVEKLHTSEYSMSRLISGGSEISLSDSFSLDGYDTNKLKVILCDAKALVRETRTTDSAVSCKGDLYLKCLFSQEGGGIFAVNRKIPFDEIISLEGAVAGIPASINSYISSLDVTMSDSSTAPSATVDIAIVLEAEAFKNDKFDAVCDAYSTKYICDCKKAYLPVKHFIGLCQSNFSIDGSLRDTKGENVLYVVDSDADVEIKDVLKENGKIVLSGSCNAAVIAAVAADNGNIQYDSFDFTIPVRYETGIRTNSEKSEYETTAYAVSTNARLDTNAILFNAELAVCVTVTENTQLEYISSAEKSNEELTTDNTLCVCYPENESLWDICKKYKKHIKDIAAANDIPEGVSALPGSSVSLDGISHIII